MITVETALTLARQTLAAVTERAERQGYCSGARTGIINSHAELRAALIMLIKAAERPGESAAPQPTPGQGQTDASGGGLRLRDGGTAEDHTPGGSP